MVATVSNKDGNRSSVLLFFWLRSVETNTTWVHEVLWYFTLIENFLCMLYSGYNGFLPHFCFFLYLETRLGAFYFHWVHSALMSVNVVKKKSLKGAWVPDLLVYITCTWETEDLVVEIAIIWESIQHLAEEISRKQDDSWPGTEHCVCAAPLFFISPSGWRSSVRSSLPSLS